METTYIALLRGINVSGKNKIAMSDLRDLCSRLGYEDVRTYIQSGNALFRAPTGHTETKAALEGAIATALGLEVTVLLRTVDEMRQVADNNPFLQPGYDPSHLHVTFLPERPPASDVNTPNSGRDEYRLMGREIYLSCPDGYGNTKLNNSFWERRLRMPGTTRNWRTVMTLLGMAKG